MAIELKPLLEYRVDVELPEDVGDGPFGHRLVFNVVGGEFQFLDAPDKGVILPRGGDWMLLGPDGVRRLDVRATFRTDDGADIMVSYLGVVVLAPAIEMKIARGEFPTAAEMASAYFYTHPRFETGHPKYARLNRMVALGEGTLSMMSSHYRIYEVVSP